ncbi:MAG: alpha/beta fold hydrolase [Candidatus Calescibacterium sp.]|nr:alpha/beta fold hydrolase [Candidatus Calescibacterium sp.]
MRLLSGGWSCKNWLYFSTASILLLNFFYFSFSIFPSKAYGQVKGESIWTETEDGRQIHIFFIRKRGEARSNYPVILCHGLGAQGMYWYFSEKSSWALELAKNGFDVFVPDLRGVGKSGGSMKFDFYDYQKDVIAIIDKVKKVTGAQKVHWVGHSMGGMVVYLTATEKPEIINNNLASLSIISSPYKIWQPFEAFRLLKKNFDEVSEALRRVDSIPFSFFAGFYRFAFPILQISEDVSPIIRSFQYFIWNLDLVDPDIRREVTLGTANVSSQVLDKFFRVGLGFEDFGFDLRNLSVPSIFVVGVKDLLATPPTVRLAYIKAGVKEKKFFLAGVGEGFSADYGHVDINVIPRSIEEVFPIVLDHINKNDERANISKTKIGEEIKRNKERKVDVGMGMKISERKSEKNSMMVIRSSKRESKYSFMLLQDFGLKSDIWNDFIEILDEKDISYTVPHQVTTLDEIVGVLDFFCKSGTSSYNIAVLHGFAGSTLLKLKTTCFDAIFLVSAPVREISRYYRMYLESGGRISKSIIEQLFDKNVDVLDFSSLGDILDDLISSDFLIEDRQRIFFVLSVGTRTQYWWDIGEIPNYFRSYNTLLLSYVNFAEDLSHIELIAGKKAKKYVIPYIMNQIANLKK